jgi:hypothetical protein
MNGNCEILWINNAKQAHKNLDHRMRINDILELGKYAEITRVRSHAIIMETILHRRLIEGSIQCWNSIGIACWQQMLQTDPVLWQFFILGSLNQTQYPALGRTATKAGVRRTAAGLRTLSEIETAIAICHPVTLGKVLFEQSERQGAIDVLAVCYRTCELKLQRCQNTGKRLIGGTILQIRSALAFDEFINRTKYSWDWHNETRDCGGQRSWSTWASPPSADIIRSGFTDFSTIASLRDARAWETRPSISGAMNGSSLSRANGVCIKMKMACSRTVGSIWSTSGIPSPSSSWHEHGVVRFLSDYAFFNGIPLQRTERSQRMIWEFVLAENLLVVDCIGDADRFEVEVQVLQTSIYLRPAIIDLWWGNSAHIRRPIALKVGDREKIRTLSPPETRNASAAASEAVKLPPKKTNTLPGGLAHQSDFLRRIMNYTHRLSQEKYLASTLPTVAYVPVRAWSKFYAQIRVRSLI